ncbi:MAG: TolC family protein [Acidobacteria bacterium]|nr:TolC family protein [Acidobacteriota bacterium]
MRVKTTILMIVSLILCSTSFIWSENVPEYTLNDLWQKALLSNESIKIATNQVDVADAGVRQAWSSILPTIDAAYLGTYYDREYMLDFEGTKFEIMPRLSYTFQATITQPIFTGFRSINGINMANAGSDIAESAEGYTREMIYLGIAGLYYQISMYQKEVEVLEQSIEIAQKELGKAQLRFDVGEVTKPSVLLAELTLKDNERKLTLKRNSLSISKNQLANMVGLRGEYKLTEPETMIEPEADLDQMIQTALIKRKEIKMAELKKKMAGYETNIAWGGLYPVVTVQAQYFEQAASFPYDGYASLGLVVSFTLFDGGNTWAKISESKAKERISDLELMKLMNDVKVEVEEAYSNLQTMKSTLQLAEVQLQLAKEYYELNSSLYEVGDATALELSTAMNAYDQAKITLSNMKYSKDLAILSLKKAIGELFE